MVFNIDGKRWHWANVDIKIYKTHYQSGSIHTNANQLILNPMYPSGKSQGFCKHGHGHKKACHWRYTT
jgi:hypothetical protein